MRTEEFNKIVEEFNNQELINIAMEENFSEQLQIFNFIKTTNKNEYIIKNKTIFS